MVPIIRSPKQSDITAAAAPAVPGVLAQIRHWPVSQSTVSISAIPDFDWPQTGGSGMGPPVIQHLQRTAYGAVSPSMPREGLSRQGMDGALPTADLLLLQRVLKAAPTGSGVPQGNGQEGRRITYLVTLPELIGRMVQMPSQCSVDLGIDAAGVVRFCHISALQEEKVLRFESPQVDAATGDQPIGADAVMQAETTASRKRKAPWVAEEEVGDEPMFDASSLPGHAVLSTLPEPRGTQCSSSGSAEQFLNQRSRLRDRTDRSVVGAEWAGNGDGVPVLTRQERQRIWLAYPRPKGEKNMAYARRLHAAGQRGEAGAMVDGERLSIEQLARLSGATEANLRLDPQLQGLPPELEPIRLAYPRREGENHMAYARRLHAAGQRGEAGAMVDGERLSIEQLARLSGATEASLRQDPQLQGLPPELEPIRLAYPRRGGENHIAYARRLHAAGQRGEAGAMVDGERLSIEQLARLSGATESHLRQDPQLQGLPPELEPIRLAYPRRGGENHIAYARRLHEAGQRGEAGAMVDGERLSIEQLARLSGAMEANLRLDPQLQGLPPELEPIRLAYPHRGGENHIAYARRLHEAGQRGEAGAMVDGERLSIEQLARLSGATEANLRLDPQLQGLPPELEPIRLAYPRRGGEKNMAYARRLHAAGQRGEAGAMVDGERLSIEQLARLSGAMEANLRLDPQLQGLPPELEPIRLAYPRPKGENNMAYARRLHAAGQRGEAGAMVDGERLSIEQLARLSGATEASLHQDPQLQGLPPELEPIRLAYPRRGGEKNMAYARRLHAAGQRGEAGAMVDGERLSIEQLARLSGATETKLRWKGGLK
ncbi:hypothetical protein [Noviherbaspirillum saxi]|uniref:Uncharacterized protein n=1 Tax=Noviherbaspirillum saxi TaxID=2320863 RepID=A0A3A3FM05_9BURK|nr:hypothetical protein [Noviherbaspirillum saxi]RJF92562.1 hypothetical protein D3871_28625 [Noviherbaspirillum saxi]